MTALERLAAAIEAGEDRSDWMPWIDPMDRTRGILPYKFANIPSAYNGSLDAAKALHDAALQGWRIELKTETRVSYAKVICVASVFSDDVSSPMYFERIRAVADNNLARAWLLAIVRALIAKEKKV